MQFIKDAVTTLFMRNIFIGDSPSKYVILQF